ncbi:carbohydrate kinase [Bacillus sp. RG28]|uniref:Carbohydrate kinase n=1 Tax=Gottfriedia endophytica TaxID=2820819 RepID=A0A940NS10_9BACI|nr:carbohydrate kinase [Gottfriedia endophytica]MBP0726473.1 carbohydrate kinase [Gottfriedia endophytica]
MNRQGVISLGEAFVDLISQDQTNTKYDQFLGGATVNLVVGTRRLGVPSYYLCKLGSDDISDFVKEELKKEKVNIDYSVHTSTKKVCCVYVHLNDNGERYFHSYVNETPDEWITNVELEEELFKTGKILSYGSGTLFHEVSRETTEQALVFARKYDLLTAFDTNIRLKRWESEEKCRETIYSFFKHADIVKMAEDELLFLTETQTIDEGLRKIAELNIPYLFITMGNEGAFVLHDGNRIDVPGINVNVVDTTGAGDAFLAAILYSFHEKGLPTTHSQLKEYLQFANQTAADTTTKIGAL